MKHDAATAAVFCELAATLLLGLMAGFFFAFAVDVAPAMRELDAAGYITTQQAINRVVRNALFGGVYFGSALLPALAALLLRMAGQRRSAAGWLVVWAVYAAGVFWLTRTVNVPINDALAQWNPSAAPANWAAAREQWNDANLARTGVAIGAFVGALGLLARRRVQPLPAPQARRTAD